MTRPRADLGFGDALAGFDPADWAPAAPPPPRPDPEALRALAVATGFPSRSAPPPEARAGRDPGARMAAPPETGTGPGPGPGAGAGTERGPGAGLPPSVRSAAPTPPPGAAAAGLPRRRRTGRNMQFNLKARPETIAAFCALADAKGWGLGETFEEALRLLEAAHGRPSADTDAP